MGFLKFKNNTKSESSTTQKLPKPVYYIKSPEDDTVLVGLDVKISRETKNGHVLTTVSWHDTNKFRYMAAQETAAQGDCFAFRRIQEEGDGKYFFIPMTLEIYNQYVKPTIIGSPSYTSEQELIDGFLSAAKD